MKKRMLLGISILLLSLCFLVSSLIVEARSFSWTNAGYKAQETITITADEVWTTGNSYTIHVSMGISEIDTNPSFLSPYNNDYIKLTEVEINLGYQYTRAVSPFQTMRKGDTWERSWSFTPKADDFFLSRGESTTEPLSLEMTFYVVETDGTEHQDWFYKSEVKIKIKAGADAPRAKDGCFIATSVYGTSQAEDIDALRSVRDKVLMPTPPGKAFIGTYYSMSPPIARVLEQNDSLRTGTRILLIIPLVYGAKLILSLPALLIIGSLLGISISVLRKYHKLNIAFKALGSGAITIILFTVLVFLLGYFAYTWSFCAITAAYILPAILPVSILVVALKWLVCI